MYDEDKRTLIEKQVIKTNKKAKLRHNEYYNMQPTFDLLYEQSRNNSKFKNLYNVITRQENILLAYRNIKRNHGSKTAGTNRHTLSYWENKPVEYYINYIRTRLENYQPQKVRRVEIPKPNGKTRPLGIPCIEDRLIQQCIKQVLEPICEAKFHHHSYGFRPNRGTDHAIAYLMKKINLDKNYFIVDVDIKGFFDNVNHSKLIKQMWSMGIQDKKLLSIISAMLKAEVDGIGISDKGVPQGGILSPLLSNIVLNEFDWWISNQWETYNTNYIYCENHVKYNHLRRKSKLKEIYIVRYADDFKITCKNYNTANKIYNATKQWLKERLGLDISPEKSCITDVRKDSSEFLGLSINTVKKGRKRVVKSHMTNKAKQHVQSTLKEQINYIHRRPNLTSIYIFNQLISGLHNYYKIATEVSKDFAEIHYKLSYCLKKKFRTIRTKQGRKSKEYLQKYGHFKGREINILGVCTYPISYIRTNPPQVHNKDICNYTTKGRKLIHKKIGHVDLELLNYMAKNPIEGESVEFNDNRLSLYSAQKGKCIITKRVLDENMKVHRIIPKSLGGTDEYKNMLLVSPVAYELMNTDNSYDFLRCFALHGSSKDALNKIYKYRTIMGNKEFRLVKKSEYSFYSVVTL